MDYPYAKFGHCIFSHFGFNALNIFFAYFDPVTLTFELIIIAGRRSAMDYLCAKFGDFGLSCFGFIVRTGRQTDRITESKMRMITIPTQLPSASVIMAIFTVNILLFCTAFFYNSYCFEDSYAYQD